MSIQYEIVEKEKKKAFVKTGDSIIFIFDDQNYGYFLDDYDPSMTEFKFRMRSLIFMFNRLDIHAEGFRDLKQLNRVQYLRRKAIVIFVLFLVLLLPSIFALQLITGGQLRTASSTLVIIGLVSASVISAQFLIINLNKSKMEKRIALSKIARSIKKFLLRENYYWLFKHFVIFDVDKNLNIHLIFMDKSPIAKKHDVHPDRCRRILRENNLVIDML